MEYSSNLCFTGFECKRRKSIKKRRGKLAKAEMSRHKFRMSRHNFKVLNAKEANLAKKEKENWLRWNCCDISSECRDIISR